MEDAPLSAISEGEARLCSGKAGVGVGERRCCADAGASQKPILFRTVHPDGSDRSRAFLNASFCKKGGKWRGEPQLFFVFSETGLECGFSIEWYMGAYLERFHANFSRNESLMNAWLDEAAADDIGLSAKRIKNPDETSSFHAESFITDNQEIRISAKVSKDQMLSWPRSRLAAHIADAMARLHPVLQMACDEEAPTSVSAEIEQEAPVVREAPAGSVHSSVIQPTEEPREVVIEEVSVSNSMEMPMETAALVLELTSLGVPEIDLDVLRNEFVAKELEAQAAIPAPAPKKTRSRKWLRHWKLLWSRFVSRWRR